MPSNVDNACSSCSIASRSRWFVGSSSTRKLAPFAIINATVVTGLVIQQEGNKIHVLPNPLKPEEITIVDKSNVEEWRKSDVSTMPEGLLDTFQRDEILDLLSYIQAGGK